MFEGSLVESTALLQKHNRWPALLSVCAQTAFAVTLIAMPMIHPELLPKPSAAIVLAPPPVPRAPQPLPHVQRIRAALVSTTRSAVAPAPAGQGYPPHTILSASASTVEAPAAVSMGPMTGSGPDVGFASIVGNGHSPDVRVASSTTVPREALVQLSSGVTAGMLLTAIQPVYPAIAKAARQEGSVVIRAIISRMGQIERAQVVSGSPMLTTAALEAVQRARYKPYLLNGQATQVETLVTINFRLGS